MRAALIQTCTGIDPADNAAGLVAQIGVAAAAGADMAFTPEMCGLLDRDPARAAPHRCAEADDPVLDALREAAARHAIWINVGSLGLRAGKGDDRLVNRSFVIDAAGAIRARYDKIHLFDVTLPGGETWQESAAYRPGDRAVVAATPWGRLGLTVCYDLRFPALFAALAEAGAELIAVPAAFTVPTGAAHWHVLLRARAIEAAAFVLAAAQSGVHADGRATYGHSLAVDPWGEVLADLGAGASVRVVELDFARLRDVRARLPALAHRRTIAPAEVTP